MAIKKVVIHTRGEAGQPVDVWKITRQKPAGTFDDPHATFEGLAELRLPDGTPVNQDGDDFVVVRTGERLRPV